MFPESISENLMYSTVRIITDTSTGTGFFYTFTIGGKDVPVLITNKHVVDYQTKKLVRLILHTGNPDEKHIDSEKLSLDYSVEWIQHPSQDLCFCFINPLIKHVRKKENKNIFFRSLSPDMIYSPENLESLNAIENVIMIGYPNGLWNANDNFPLFRKGITASHPGVNFKGESHDMQKDNIGVVDMACFPGSSGSPIFILDESSYSDKRTATLLAGSRLIFLGILFAGPTMDVNGKIIVQNQQNIFSKSSVMINLGYYIKGYELNEFNKIIEEILLQKGEL